MPKVWTGNFAQVYELTSGSKRWAVKCFTRSSGNLTVRYAAISSAIVASKLPYFVDFRFMADEMLVGNTRYPIVKMQWLEGQFIDKFVEANLYQPRHLIDLAVQLVLMVNELEKHNLAHGDLQHGNIVVTPSGIQLVDYDGMFVPSFAGTVAPEIGLPSFQHPKRGAAHYAVGLDRFALLVICTGLCAVAVEPSIWYEFYTGDNLLFSAADFRAPNDSKLFHRLTTLHDENVKRFSNALRAACARGPLDIQVPAPPTELIGARAKPWWLQSPPASAAAANVQTRTAASWSVPTRLGGGSALLLVIGTLALATGWLAGFGAGAGTLTIGGLLLLLSRVLAYTKLPALVRRSELKAKLAKLEHETRERNQDRMKLEQQLTALSQQENAEKGEALRRNCATHLQTCLSSISVGRLASISGVGPAIIGRLQSAGIQNAAQLKRWGPNVHGVGPKRRKQIYALLSQWESEATRSMPRSLTLDEERRIADKYQSQKGKVIDQLGAVRRLLSGRQNEASQAESELKQLHVPTFGQFLRNTL